MLTRVEIKGYKSLKDIDLDMKELTVLIGPNGSGKSNFLDVFALMSQAAVGALGEGIIQRGGMGNVLFKQGQEQLTLQFYQEATDYYVQIEPNQALPRISEERMIFMETGDTDSLLVLHRKQRDVNFHRSHSVEAKKLESETELSIFQVRDQAVYPEPYKLLRQMQNWSCYTPMEVDARSPMRLPQVWRSGMRLLLDGSNLFSVLKTIQDESPDDWAEITEILKIIYEDFRYMTFPAEGGDGKILLRWWEHPFEKAYSFSADLLSDGTLRLLSLLAILKSPEPPPLICIEEPELGLHPDWIKLVGELLESAATRTQIIVATHSPMLVSYVQPQHVVVVEKEDGMTYMERLTEEEMADWLDDFQLGDLWLSGQIGGRP